MSAHVDGRITPIFKNTCSEDASPLPSGMCFVSGSAIIVVVLVQSKSSVSMYCRMSKTSSATLFSL
eukprot:2904981-Prorocentrum_lima.AAC.1